MPSPRGQQYLGEELDDAESQVAKSLAKEAEGALEAAGDSADVPEDPLHVDAPVDSQPKEVADEEEGDPDAIPLAEKLIENGQEHGEEADVEFGNQRVNYRFQRMSKAFEQQHEKIDRLVRLRIKNVNQSSIDEDEKVAKIEALNIGWRRINQTFANYGKQTQELQMVLDRNYSSVDQILKWHAQVPVESRKKIEELQIEVMREHKELQKIEEVADRLDGIEKARQKPVQPDQKESVVEEQLKKVAGAADDLHRFLDDGAFLKAQWKAASSLQTVVKFYSRHETEGQKLSSEQKRNIMSWLVDADNNQYVLTKPSDRTNQPQDELLLRDLMIVLALSWFLGIACSHVGLPEFIGYILAGCILGPSGANIITNMVQIGTLGELGIFLLLFVLGLEFSLQRLREVFHTAVVGGSAFTICVFLVTLILGSVLSRPAAESAVCGFIVALSSTTVAANNLNAVEVEQPYGRGLLGILIMQDVYVGVIMAVRLSALVELVLRQCYPSLFRPWNDDVLTHCPKILPILGVQGGLNMFDVTLHLGRLLLSFLVLGVLVLVLTRFALRKFLQELRLRNNSTKLMGGIVLCFGMLQVTDALGLSSELGCFVAGIALNMAEDGDQRLQGQHVVRSLEHIVKPLQDFFLSIFFCAVGMHVYPTFLLENIRVLLYLTVAVVLVKYLVSFTVLSFLHGPSQRASSHVVSVGLAQVSEFGFVLASRAKAMRVVPHSVYFLLISVTGVTLLLAPVLWTATTRKTRRSLDARGPMTL